MISAEQITKDEFEDALGRYPALIRSVSDSKSQPKGTQDQLTLEVLDNYRFEVAPKRYTKKEHVAEDEAGATPLTHADVVQLVRWKLKHGQFRPNLLNLVESNSSDEVEKTTKEAFEAYRIDNYKVTKAISILTRLKGIGPATASLLLSVHHATKVVFFGDEVFRWICCDGKNATIKYTAKEYEDLVAKSGELIERLNLDARDVEKVGFVLMREGAEQKKDEKAKKDATRTELVSSEAPKKKRQRKSGPPLVREPTDMTEERKAQLTEIAAKGRAARVARKETKAAQGAKFRERIDAARAKKKDDESSETGTAEVGAKRKSDITTRGAAASAKRPKRSA